MQILWVFQSDVFMVQKGFYLILYKTSKIVFSRFIVTIYYMEIQGVTRGDGRLQGVTRGDRRLQGITGGYKGLQQVTKDYRKIVSN